MAAPDAILHQIYRRLGDARSDRDLLHTYVARRCDDAFRAIVARHGPAVLGLCRRFLGDMHQAEDAFQATFLQLARQAAAVRNPEALSAWLHRTALRVCGRARQIRDRRRAGEARATQRTVAEPAAEVSASELLAALDAELDRLPDRYRLPLALVYWQGLTHAEAGRRLGLTPGTLHGRLDRGRARLSERLTRRGFAPSALLVAPLAAVAVPAELLARAAALTVPNTAIPATVLALASLNGATKVLPIVGVAVLFASAGLIGLTGGIGPPQPPPPPKPASRAVSDDKPTAARTLRVIVLDPQGKLLPGAIVHSGIWTFEKDFKSNRDYETDAAGVAQVELPKTFYILRLWASKNPLVTMFANWEQNELASGQGPPAEYTFRLESGVTAGGRIVDEMGNPIAGAKVDVSLSGELKPASADGRMGYDMWLANVKTNADGRWRIENVPNHAAVVLNIQVYHPDYVSDPFRGQAQKAAGITTEMMRKETAVLALKRGVIVQGRVVDPAGKPIQDALVIYGNDPYAYSSGGGPPSDAPTDADGRYRLPALAPGNTALTVIAQGWAPQLRRVNLTTESASQNFQLSPGKTIRLRIVDAGGKPVSEARVALRGWKGISSLHNINHSTVRDTRIPRMPNADGVWEWTWAPDDPVKLQIGLRDFASQELELGGGAPERVVVLKPQHRITGRVTDAVTGKPIPAFVVIPIDVFRKDQLHAERGNAKAGTNGKLDYLATRTDIPLRIRVEAPGYRTQTGPEFRVGDDSPRTQDFRLQPGPPISGIVHGSDGKPANNAEVLLATPTEQVAFQDDWGNHKTTTDSAGKFSFPDSGEPFAVLARTNAGFAQAEFTAGVHDAGTMRLQPWASVRGQFRDSGKRLRGATIILQPIPRDSRDRPKVDASMQVVTGPDGRFEFLRLPPGPVCVRVYIGPWKDEGFRSGPSVPLELKPGDKAELDLGGAGATVSGKVKLTGKVPKDLDCTYSVNYLIRREPGITPPHEIAKLGFDIRKGWRDTWLKSVEGQAYLNTLHSWFVKLAPDGSFRVSGVPAGEYDLAVAVYAKPNGCLTDPLARNQLRVNVTADDVARGETSVPEIAALVVPVPEVGDVPALDFQDADGKAGTLADQRGHYTVVHFWASWCGSCKQQLPALRRLHEQFAARGLATLGLSLDDDLAAWQAATKDIDFPWKQGRLRAGADSGVSSVPAYWLLDPAGKIVAKVNDTEELAKAVAERVK